MKRFIFFIAFGLLLFLSPHAFAGLLTMEVETTLGSEEDTLRGTIKVTNKGDEPAMDLRAEILSPGGGMLRKEIAKRIEPRVSASLTFDSPLTGLQKGTYPLPITVIFHDTKLYPFSALSCPVFSRGGEGRGDLICTALPVSLGERGEISFTLKNLGSKACALHAMILLPREFHTPKTRENILLEPGTTKALTLDVFNASALQGAQYPVYGIFQYDTGEMHQTLVAATTLKISEKGHWFAKTRWYWLLGGLLAALITAARRFKKG
jgi:hypothetical protein